MTKTVTIHQPNYLPWIGLFSKIALVDSFIIYDTAQYTNGSVINRNKIRTDTGWCYLTIPVNRRFFETRIMDIPLPENNRWRRDHWKTISQYYAKAQFFKEHRHFFTSLYTEDFHSLCELNEQILRYMLDSFGIKVEVVKMSELNIDPDLRSTDMLTAALRKVDANCYLSGPSGRNYLNLGKFAENNINIRFFNFIHPVYQQRYPGFESNLSALDLLFNMGPESEEIIRKAGKVLSPGNNRETEIVPGRSA